MYNSCSHRTYGYVLRCSFCVSVALALMSAVVLFASREILPSADQIAFESDQTGNWDIYLLDTRVYVLRNLTQHPADDFAPSWSPDGSELLFYSDYNGDGRAELHILNMATLKIRTFGEPSLDYRRAAWSPDGHQLVYTVGYGQMRLANIEDSASRPLGYGFSPECSPDGRWIMYYADSQDSLNAEIYALNAGGNRVLNLSRNLANDWSPTWSPDGQTIAFVTSRDGNAELYLMQHCLLATPNCSGDLLRLTFNPGNDSSPAWSPDGHSLAYETERNGRHDLYLIDVNNLQSLPLYATPADERSPAWRPRP